MSDFNPAELWAWIFDMDGTLTIPIHDFAVIRRELGIPETADILGWIESLPPEEAAGKNALLEEIELELAHRTKAQPGIHALLERLVQRECRVGIITRNNLLNTSVTLKAAGLDRFFPEECIRTRECALPKPDPEAVHQLMSIWKSPAESTVICGDYKHDLNAGIHAGIRTIYFNSRSDDQWKNLADLTVTSWDELSLLLNDSGRKL